MVTSIAGRVEFSGVMKIALMLTAIVLLGSEIVLLAMGEWMVSAILLVPCIHSVCVGIRVRGPYVDVIEGGVIIVDPFFGKSVCRQLEGWSIVNRSALSTVLREPNGRRVRVVPRWAESSELLWKSLTRIGVIG